MLGAGWWESGSDKVKRKGSSNCVSVSGVVLSGIPGNHRGGTINIAGQRSSKGASSRQEQLTTPHFLGCALYGNQYFSCVVFAEKVLLQHTEGD